ncbi:MAG: AAA family ATPase [Cyclobacteriaceae bacterium]|nr:AAA family ATPase [Cyclobacteriaceae bacterium]
MQHEQKSNFLDDIKDDIEKLTNQSSELSHEVTAEELLKYPIKEIERLLDPIFPRSGVACLGGSSDTGKSAILKQLSAAISIGDASFLDFKLNTKHKSALYVSTEDGRDETNSLLNRQCPDASPGDLKGLRFIFSTEFEPQSLFDLVKKSISTKPVDLVVIDALGDVFQGNLKDTTAIRSFLHPYQALADRNKCLIIFLHHTSKRSENFEPNKNNLLGGQGLEAKTRTLIELRADNTDLNKRHFCITKGNYLSSQYKNESFVLLFDEGNLTFKNTGERTPITTLKKLAPNDGFLEKFQKALELKKEGKTTDEIAQKIGYSSKGSVSKLFAKAETLGLYTN